MTGPTTMSATAEETTQPRPPVARRMPVVSTYHGVDLTDDYAWLRADNWQEVMREPQMLAADIRTHLEAENAYTKAMLADTEGLQERLFQEMKARLKEDDQQVPQPDGPYEYFPRFVKGGQYAQLCRIPRGGSLDDTQVLLDGNAEAEGKSYWDLGAAVHSSDHALLAYAIDDKGSELYTVRIRDLTTGKNLADEIPDTHGSLEWSSDRRTLFYIKVDEHQRPLFVYSHVLGTPVSQDKLVYEEKDRGFLRRAVGDAIAKIHPHRHSRSRDERSASDRCRCPRGRPPGRDPAARRPPVRCRTSRSASDHCDELGGCRGFPRRRGADRRTA